MDSNNTLYESAFYVRHGSTYMSKTTFRLKGPQDFPLNNRGIWEVGQAIEDIGSHKVTLIAAAPSLRTIETAQILSMHFGIPYIICDGLKARDLGPFEAYKNKLPRLVRNEGNPAFFKRVEERLEEILPPEAEKLDAFKLRTSETIKKILRLPGSPIIVGHGSALRGFNELNNISQTKDSTSITSRKYGTVFEFKLQKNPTHKAETSDTSDNSDTDLPLLIWHYMYELSNNPSTPRSHYVPGPSYNYSDSESIDDDYSIDCTEDPASIESTEELDDDSSSGT